MTRLLRRKNIENECLASLCRGIETAQKLRRSLQGIPAPKLMQQSRKHFVEFIELEFPTRTVAVYGDPPSAAPPHPPYSEMIYEIRCKAVHENENLNAAEKPIGEIQVDWTLPDGFGGHTTNGIHFVNGKIIAIRLRGILAKFVMGLESIGSGTININMHPPIGSIRSE